MTVSRTNSFAAAELLQYSAAEIDGPLRAAVAQLPEPLCAAAGFHFGWWDAEMNPVTAPHGKMLRPALVLNAARAFDGDRRNNNLALRAGIAIELVHNFSLVHDDIMDVDRTRRGRPTVWTQFGVPSAILLGDALLALAGQVLAQEGEPNAAALCAELGSVVVALCQGQQRDMDFEQLPAVSVDDYLTMAAGKTSALISGACVLGSMAGGALNHQVSAFRRFGHHMGLAFQLVDDVLGIYGDPDVTGKPVGADLLRYKKTMPVVAAMASDSAAGESLVALYRTRSITAERLPEAVELVDQAGGRERTEAEAQHQWRLALRCLDEIGGDLEAIEATRALADLMLTRSK
ncbi:polyprenyl synthetase family protein [Lentzea alba]|uniref:polyprenyl synthetase family protein n=1 Tax=Lentzea alba TaxID=2714351 RepID=UPI0039BFB685